MTKQIDSKIRNFDANNYLVQAGYQWTESSVPLQIGGWLAMAASFLPFMIGMLAANMPGGGAGLLIFGGIGLAMLIGGHMVANVWAHRARSLIFESGGDIRVPHGIPFTGHARTLTCRVDEVANIELHPGYNQDTGVALLSTEGDTVLVAHNLKTDSGRKVAVQLTRALEELRLSLAEGHSSVYAPVNERLASYSRMATRPAAE